MGIGSADKGPLGASGLQTDLLWGHRVCRQRYVGASGLQTEVFGGIGYGYRGLRGHGLQTESARASVLQTEVCAGIGSADRRLLSALGLQTEVYGGIGFGDRGLRGHRVCRQMTAGANINDKTRSVR